MYVKPNKLMVVASVWELETLLVTLEKVDMTLEILSGLVFGL